MGLLGNYFYFVLFPFKDCEAGAGRTPSVRRRKYRKYTLSEQILADLPDSLKIRQNPAKLN